MSAREPGIVGVALTDERLTVGIIVDGIHVDPLVVRAAFAAKGRSNIALVSDAMPTVGTKQDHFELMGRQIQLRNGRLDLPPHEYEMVLLRADGGHRIARSEEHTSELQSLRHLVCRLL